MSAKGKSLKLLQILSTLTNFSKFSIQTLNFTIQLCKSPYISTMLPAYNSAKWSQCDSTNTHKQLSCPAIESRKLKETINRTQQTTFTIRIQCHWQRNRLTAYLGCLLKDFNVLISFRNNIHMKVTDLIFKI